MSTSPAPLPLTIQSALSPTYGIGIHIGIGTSAQVIYPQNIQPNSYWFVVLDRTSLQVVANVIQTTNDSAPAAVASFTGNSQYLLIVSTYALSNLNVPQGALYDFLNQNGAGPELARLEQINEQLSCGEIGTVSYSLVDDLGSGGPGFEASALGIGPGTGAIQTLQLLPLIGPNGQTYWTPNSL